MALWYDKRFDDPSHNGSEGSLYADSAKCPSCGSNILYEPKLGGLLCRNCGGLFGAETLEPRGSFGINKEHDYLNDEDVSGDDKTRREIVCNSCGATLVTDENTMSTMCPFCGSPALITKRMSREFKPDYIIPFKVEKESAKSLLRKWLTDRKYTPIGFKNNSKLDKITALYVPFWLLDCCVNSELSGTGKKGRMIHEVNTHLKYYVKGIPFDASLDIPNRLMAAVEPYDYHDMVKFESRYLQGFYADKYDQLPTEMTERITNRIDKFSITAGEMVGKKYTEYESSPEKEFTFLSEVSIKYCLLPVWFTTVNSRGKQYQFAVNGQTGEVCGQVPTSEGADLYDRFIDVLNRNTIFTVMIYMMAAFALALGIVVFFSYPHEVNPVKSALTVIMSICLALDIILFFVFWIMRASNRSLSHRKGRSAYDINDYDKEPPLETYFDQTRRSEYDSKEIPLYAAQVFTNRNGEVIGDRNSDF